MLSEPQCPLVKLGLELALEPGPARVQKLGLQEPQVQALVQVAELAQLEPQVQLELEPRLQRSQRGSQR